MEEGFQKYLIASCAKIIALLHVRAKENTSYEMGLRTPDERDAELAVHCLACILTELRLTQ